MPLSTAASAAIERAEEQSQPSVGGALGGVGVPAVEGERADARPVGVCHEFCRGACRRSPPDRVVWRPVAGVKPSRIFCADSPEFGGRYRREQVDANPCPQIWARAAIEPRAL
jgi:hypothetical protein